LIIAISRATDRLSGEHEEYAKESPTTWNIKRISVVWVTRFKVKIWRINQYPIHQVRTSHLTEWSIPAEELEGLNENIFAKIEDIAGYSSKRVSSCNRALSQI